MMIKTREALSDCSDHGFFSKRKEKGSTQNILYVVWSILIVPARCHHTYKLFLLKIFLM